MKILITGGAGFIGFHLSRKLLKETENQIVAIDNLNDYYDVQLKEDRLTILYDYNNFKFIRMDLLEKEKLDSLFESEGFDIVIHLAAQA
ncbi:TPA: NAD-dependent epimerase/dehydratase family protein, partial [Enterococcus faecium]